MTLSEAIVNNNVAYAKWRAYGQREADDILNDSNRELIRAYQQEYPNAKGYKARKSMQNLTNLKSWI